MAFITDLVAEIAPHLEREQTELDSKTDGDDQPVFKESVSTTDIIISASSD